jgi:polysaccharide biosynthesis transport protein
MDQNQQLAELPKNGELRSSASDYPSSYTGFYDEDISEGRRTVQQYFRIVYKRLPLIIALTALVTAAAAFYVYRQATIYEATTEMIIEPRKPRVTSKDAININFGHDVNYYNTQIQLLTNFDLMKDVVITLGLYRDPGLFANQDRGVLGAVRSIFSSGEEETTSANSLPVVTDLAGLSDPSGSTTLTAEEDVRASRYASILLGGLTVRQRERTNLVNVSIKSTNAALAPKVADAVAVVFKEKDAERETIGMKRAAEDLTKSIEELQNTISEQEAQLIMDMKSFGLPLQEKGQDLAASRLGALSATYMTTMEARRQIEGRYNAAVAASARGEATNLPDLYENKIYQDTVRLNTERRAKLQDDIRNLDKQIQDLEAKRQADSTKYTDEHPEMKALIARIESVKETRVKTEKEVSQIIEFDQKKIEKEAVSGALVALKSQLDAKRREEAQSLAAYEREAAVANVQGQAQTKLTSLRREIDTKRNLLDTYTQRLKEQELAIQSEAPDNIKIAANAGTAIAVGPQRGRNITVAFLLALAAGIGLAFLLDYLDDSVRTSEDVGRHLGLPTLALIPHYFGSEKRRLRLSSANGNGSADGIGSSLVALEERQSPMAEAYRHLRTSLLFSSAGKPPQTILVTSSQPSEGKTTTAINTAVTLAQANADVILVDCDLRRPRVHNYFGLENTHGLTNYLSGDRSTENLVKSCPDLPRLKIITSGPIPPNPAELLSSNEMKNLLQFLSGRYKHIVIDSPPAISFTDAAILSTLVDGVVLVAMAGSSSLQLMRRFKLRLANLGARIYGVVLNGIKADSVEYEYYTTGYYNYYMKSETDTATPVMEDAASVDTTKN